jgi:lysozyme
VSRFDAALLERALRAIGKPAPVPEREPTSAIDVAAALARRFEGFRSRPYLCPAGVPTIGYGATRYLDGRRVQLTDPPISQAAADRLLLRQLERDYLPAVLRLCPGLVGEAPERLAAIVDFTFNLGQGRLSSSTLRRRINAGDWDSVPSELRKWVIGGGVVLRGLVLRRQAEAALV